MLKKIIISIIVLAVCGAGLLYALKKDSLFKSKYTLNGTIALCKIKDTPMYQYIPNTEKPIPQHFNYSGKPIPCEFKGQFPSPGCKLLLSSIGGCRIIYRTDKNMFSLPGIFTASATQALSTLSDKIK